MRVVRVSDAGVVRVMMAHRSDRATAAEPVVSALRDGIPCAEWWADDPEFIEWLDEMERQDNDRHRA